MNISKLSSSLDPKVWLCSVKFSASLLSWKHHICVTQDGAHLPDGGREHLRCGEHNRDLVLTLFHVNTFTFKCQQPAWLPYWTGRLKDSKGNCDPQIVTAFVHPEVALAGVGGMSKRGCNTSRFCEVKDRVARIWLSL